MSEIIRTSFAIDAETKDRLSRLPRGFNISARLRKSLKKILDEANV